MEQLIALLIVGTLLLLSYTLYIYVASKHAVPTRKINEFDENTDSDRLTGGIKHARNNQQTLNNRQTVEICEINEADDNEAQIDNEVQNDDDTQIDNDDQNDDTQIDNDDQNDQMRDVDNQNDENDIDTVLNLTHQLDACDIDTKKIDENIDVEIDNSDEIMKLM